MAFHIGTLTWPAPGPPAPPAPGFLAWYDASQIAGVSDGTALAVWPDLSGNGYDLTQPTSAQRPTFYKTTSAKLVNGLPAVWFTAAGNTGMQNYGGFATPPQVFSVAIVARTTNAALQQTLTDGFGANSGSGTNTNDLELMLFHNSFLGFFWTLTLDASVTPSSARGDTSLHSFMALWRGAPGQAALYFDGAATTSTIGGNTKTLDHFELGNRWDYAQPLDGPICEAIVWPYDIAFPTDYTPALHSYFSAKWGTP